MIFSTVMTDVLGRLLGLESAQSIEGYDFSLAAPWAHDAPAWLLFGCLGLVALAVVFYGRYHRHKSAGVRTLLGVFRATALCLLLLLLAEPILTVTVTSLKRPSLWFLFDGTDSMAIADEFSQNEREELAGAVGLNEQKDLKPPENASSSNNPKSPEDAKSAEDSKASEKDGPKAPSARLSRIEYVKALLAKKNDNLIERLGKDFRIRAFLFDRPDGVRSLELDAEGRERVDPAHLAAQLTTEGEVSALGAAIDDLARRHTTANLSGLVILSDFDQNAGMSPLTAAGRLGVKLYPVGVGATAQSDVAVKLQAPLLMKKDERATVNVTVQQQGLDGETVNVSVSARQIAGAEELDADAIPVGQKSVTLSAPVAELDFPFVPEQTGRFVFTAKVDPIPGEVVEENNQSEREVTVQDEFLRLLFVEYEPTWEWRFVKEVFHRDKLVGMEGFRTFLRSSDPRVRQSKGMFLETMAPPRSEFFKYDVIFLGDMPASALSSRFCEMAGEFVADFGGGLVIVSGPRFGPGQLDDTPLAALMPVRVDPARGVYDKEPFRLRLTREAEDVDFMQLGADSQENRKAWDNLGPLPWYQPVERLHPLATALAEHPTHTCTDGKTRQPIIAMRRFGRGEVIYLGFDETWRLRRKFGEQYYRQFWGQMIHRLGLSHALGSQKRFVVATDRRAYRTEDQVLLTIEAYDADFRPLGEEDIPGHRLDAELVVPAEGTTRKENVQPLAATQLRKGVYEARFPVYTAGEHRVRVTDPITEKPVEIAFQVTSVTVERQTAVRNVNLQEQLAGVVPGSKSYDLASVARLADEIELTPKRESTIEVLTLWNTWACFAALVGLLLAEWFLRKWVNLS
jgi:hypothetical protein